MLAVSGEETASQPSRDRCAAWFRCAASGGSTTVQQAGLRPALALGVEAFSLVLPEGVGLGAMESRNVLVVRRG